MNSAVEASDMEQKYQEKLAEFLKNESTDGDPDGDMLNFGDLTSIDVFILLGSALLTLLIIAFGRRMQRRGSSPSMVLLKPEDIIYATACKFWNRCDQKLK